MWALQHRCLDGLTTRGNFAALASLGGAPERYAPNIWDEDLELCPLAAISIDYGTSGPRLSLGTQRDRCLEGRVRPQEED